MSRSEGDLLRRSESLEAEREKEMLQALLETRYKPIGIGCIVIVQSDAFSGESVTFCGFTSNLTNAEIFRIPIAPSAANGLEKPSQVMIDKITTVSRSKLGKRIGKLEDSEMIRINRSIAVFAGLAD